MTKASTQPASGSDRVPRPSLNCRDLGVDEAAHARTVRIFARLGEDADPAPRRDEVGVVVSFSAVDILGEEPVSPVPYRRTRCRNRETSPSNP